MIAPDCPHCGKPLPGKGARKSSFSVVQMKKAADGASTVKEAALTLCVSERSFRKALARRGLAVRVNKSLEIIEEKGGDKNETD